MLHKIAIIELNEQNKTFALYSYRLYLQAGDNVGA